MRYLQYIREDYVGSRPSYGEVFVNPTSKEINTFTFLRFVADNKTKKFFIGNSLFLHDNLTEYLIKEKQMKSTFNCCMGAGEVKNGKINFTDYSPDFPTLVGGPEFKWAAKYFTKESEQWVLL